ncbi:hypothetical protein LCGC14_2791680 [marine sediment metagenome]|uniref:Uncharacterized protein n=1 Tax=marine sediment metagenome TaxID=412755 RepID=A0A0F8YQA2_9ZZZZ
MHYRAEHILEVLTRSSYGPAEQMIRRAFTAGYYVATQLHCCSGGVDSCTECGSIWCCNGRQCDCDGGDIGGVCAKAAQVIGLAALEEAKRPEQTAADEFTITQARAGDEVRIPRIDEVISWPEDQGDPQLPPVGTLCRCACGTRFWSSVKQAAEKASADCYAYHGARVW